MRKRISILPLAGFALFAAAGAVAIPIALVHGAPGDAGQANVPNIADGNGNGPQNGNGAPDANGSQSGAPDQGNDAGPQVRRRQMATQTITGMVLSMNLSPDGIPEGLMVQSDGKTVQLNARPDIGASLESMVAIGDQVTATAMEMPTPRRNNDNGDQGPPNQSQADHAVYEMTSLTTAKGQKLGGDADTKQHVEGNVKALNYGRRGEVNGLQLDTGDFVRLSREAAEDLKPTVGEHVAVDGMGHAMLRGHVEIAASSVNGTDVPAPPNGPPGGPGGTGGPGHMHPDDGGGPDGGPGGGAGPDGLNGMGPPDGGGGGGQDQNGPPPGQ